MCEFISWIEKDGVNLYLTTRDIKSSRGKRLRGRIGNDINGHGAIREYFNIKPDVGVEKECTDFSTPANFPADIVADIKAGKFRGFGVAVGLLTAPAWEEYDKVCAAARAEYDKVCAPAWAEYDKVCAPAWAEYDKVCAAAWAEYDKVRAPAWAEYERIKATAFWDLFAVNENRAEAWRG